MAERRRSQRVPVHDDFQVTSGVTGETVGHLRDLSRHGMVILGSAEFEVGHLYRLIVSLPEAVLNCHYLELVVLCRWHRSEASCSTHKAGFEFIGLSHRSETVIRQIQVDYAFSASETDL